MSHMQEIFAAKTIECLCIGRITAAPSDGFRSFSGKMQRESTTTVQSGLSRPNEVC